MRFYGKIEGGLFIPDDIFKSAWERFSEANENKEVQLDIKRQHGNRTLEQNRFYWCVVIEAALQGYYEAYGEHWTKEEAHLFFKTKFNHKKIINKNTGEVVEIPLTTTDLTTAEFKEYQEKVIKFIGEWFGIEI